MSFDLYVDGVFRLLIVLVQLLLRVDNIIRAAPRRRERM
jgi:hypothetical protein